jgi:hypothetical protein
MHNNSSNIRLLVRGQASRQGSDSNIAENVTERNGIVRQTWTTGDQLRVVAEFPSDTDAALFRLACRDPAEVTLL